MFGWLSEVAFTQWPFTPCDSLWLSFISSEVISSQSSVSEAESVCLELSQANLLPKSSISSPYWLSHQAQR